MVGRHMLGGHGRPTDDEEVDARLEDGRVILLRALRRQRAGDRHTCVTDFMKTRNDELRFDRFGVHTLQIGRRLTRTKLTDMRKNRLRVVIPRPQAFKVEDTDSAEPTERDRGLWAGDRIHRRADDGNVELVGVHPPCRGHVLRITCAARGDDRDVVETIGDAALLAKADFNFLRHGS